MMSKQLEYAAFHLMRKLFQSHTAAWQKAIPELTKPQYAVLHAVSNQPGIEQVELMDASVSTKATLAELLVRLEKRGLIYRQQGESDKRRRFVFLTDDGQALLTSVSQVAHDIDEQFLNRLEKTQRQALVESLKVLTSGGSSHSESLN